MVASDYGGVAGMDRGVKAVTEAVIEALEDALGSFSDSINGSSL